MKTEFRTPLCARACLMVYTLLIFSFVYGQEKNFRYYDSLTYNYYNSKNWKMLLEAGSEARQKGLNYNYLDLRMGIASYETRKYRKAVTYFEKAIQNFSTDPYTAEYLYFAYIESGRSRDASVLAGKFRDKIPMIAGANLKPVSFVYVESGYMPDFAPNPDFSELIGSDSIYGQADIYKSQSYLHAGLQLHPAPGVQLYLSASNLGITRQQRFSFLQYNSQFSQQTLTDTTIGYKFNQNELYTALSYTLLPGITLTPAFHYMGGRPDPVWVSYNNAAYQFKSGSYSYNHFVASLSLTGEIGNFSLGMGGSFAKLTTSGNQLQLNGSITWFPFSNLDFYSTTSITGFKYGDDKRLIFDQAIGGRMASKLWMEGMVTFGNLSLFNEKNAFIVYNLPERILFRSGVNLIFTLSNHVDFSVMYRFFKREYDFINYSYDVVNSGFIEQTLSTRYNNHGIYGGLKWKF